LDRKEKSMKSSTKSIITIMIVLPMLAFQCEEKIVEDCGCEGMTTTIFSDLKGTVNLKQPDDFILIFVKENDKEIPLVPCELNDTIKKEISVDNLKVIISGERKPLCKNVRYAGYPFVLNKIEILK
jgi:hypothetical protein